MESQFSKIKSIKYEDILKEMEEMTEEQFAQLEKELEGR